MGKNIVLIGLPGCGKTTVGKLLAKETGKKLYDTDQMIEKKEGRSITDIFSTDGEPYFRKIETECVMQVAKLENAVIATGGGVVLKPENMAALRKNGAVYFVDRAPASIASTLNVKKRPLLKGQKDKIFQLHKERDKLYRKYANAVCSGGTAAQLAETIALMFEMTE